MKQHIDIEELDKLSDKAKDKLKQWWKPQVGDKYGGYWSVDGLKTGFVEMNELGDIYNPGGVWLLPLLTIGEMIEFLKNEPNFNLDYSGLDDTWGVRLGEKEFGNKELADALWEAVKNTL